MTHDINSWILHARKYLHEHCPDYGKSEKALDLQCLLSHVKSRPRTWIIAHPEYQLTVDEESNLNNLLARLGNREPLPYILGHWEFFGLDFVISPAVLIPRPETELLVQEVLNWLHLHPHIDWALDIGTGSGCIAIAIASTYKEIQIIAIDCSYAALEVAKKNVNKHHATRQITLIQSHLSTAICSQKKIQLAFANLPYIPSNRLQKLLVSEFEPNTALNGGPEGLDHIKSLIIDAKRWLSADGLLLLEIDDDHEILAGDFARQLFPNACIKIIPDLAGYPRILSIKNHENNHNTL